MRNNRLTAEQSTRFPFDCRKHEALAASSVTVVGSRHQKSFFRFTITYFLTSLFICLATLHQACKYLVIQLDPASLTSTYFYGGQTYCIGTLFLCYTTWPSRRLQPCSKYCKHQVIIPRSHLKMDQYDRAQGSHHADTASAYESGTQGQRPPREFQNLTQQQQQRQQHARPGGPRNNLPSQLRAAANPSKFDRGTPLRSVQQPGQASQWPLREENAQSSPSHKQRGPPPPRPPRPSQTPLLLRVPQPASNRGPPAQSIPQYRPEPTAAPAQHTQQDSESWEDEDYGSPTYPAPNLSRPLTGSSRASTSSNYSVPDFPVPQIPPQIAQGQLQLRRAPLGPPPSARRGPSSYYSQHASIVPPIVEETDSIYSQSTRAHHDSYASSNAIPIGISDFDLDDGHTPMSDDESPFGEAYEEDSPDDRRRGIPLGHVRQASVGKRSRPTLTTIRSNDSLRPDSQTRPLSNLSTEVDSSLSTPGSESMTESMSKFPFVPAPSARISEGHARGRSIDHVAAETGSRRGLDRLSVMPESEKSLKQQRSREFLAAARGQILARSPLAQSDTGADFDYGHSEKDTPLDLDQKENTFEYQGSLAQRVGSRRPPRLDVDAVKEAEARGSLTSLPDLIKRATRLASNLDRGRTASRLGLDWFGEERRRSETSGENRRSGTSLSDILASFPPPGLATPTGSKGSRSMNQWPSGLRHGVLPSESDPGEAQPRRRRCCGMPLWLFLLLLLLLLLLVAAAVVVPVVLVVLPRMRHSGGVGAKALAACQKSLSCQNGGSNIVGTDGDCGCLCVNGYTGAQCNVKSAPGCTTTDIAGTFGVTVGDAIPRVLALAQSSFTVPLNSSIILGMFSSNNLSCNSENALVTFNGLSSRSVASDTVASEDPESYAPTSTLQRRQDATSEANPAATSNGIVFDSTPTATSISSVSSATPSASASAASANSTMLDFARIAVLFVMQDSGQLNNAISAQEKLQDYFTSGTTSMGQTIDATNITLAEGYTANLRAHTITTAGGSSVG